MDLAHPIEALIPGARGQILGAILRAGRELSTAQALVVIARRVVAERLGLDTPD